METTSTTVTIILYSEIVLRVFSLNVSNNIMKLSLYCICFNEQKKLMARLYFARKQRSLSLNNRDSLPLKNKKNYTSCLSLKNFSQSLRTFVISEVAEKFLILN